MSDPDDGYAEMVFHLMAEGAPEDQAREIAAMNTGRSWGDVIGIGPAGELIPPPWVALAEAARAERARPPEPGLPATVCE